MRCQDEVLERVILRSHRVVERERGLIVRGNMGQFVCRVRLVGKQFGCLGVGVEGG